VPTPKPSLSYFTLGNLHRHDAGVSDPTVRYYEQNADSYAEATEGLEMEALYASFVTLLPRGGRILDLGCGPGRDLVAFQKMGFEVLGVDASHAMVARSRARAGCSVEQLDFLSLDFHEDFDGIWACASLLHVPRKELGQAFALCREALRTSGTLYASFKYGTDDREMNGRRFTDLDESTLEKLVNDIPGLTLQSTWLTNDIRPERSNERWLNALLVRTEFDDEG